MVCTSLKEMLEGYPNYFSIMAFFTLFRDPANSPLHIETHNHFLFPYECSSLILPVCKYMNWFVFYSQNTVNTGFDGEIVAARMKYKKGFLAKI